MALMNAIASAKARVGNLNTSIQEVRARKQEYSAFLSEQSLGNSPLFLQMWVDISSYLIMLC